MSAPPQNFAPTRSSGSIKVTTFAVYRLADGSVHASDGLCTYGHTHLSNGLVIDGQIKCPKHNGRFDIVRAGPSPAPQP